MMEKEKQLVKIEHLYKEFDSDTKVLKDINPVSYTHLDVYKRQHIDSLRSMLHIKIAESAKIQLMIQRNSISI